MLALSFEEARTSKGSQCGERVKGKGRKQGGGSGGKTSKKSKIEEPYDVKINVALMGVRKSGFLKSVHGTCLPIVAKTDTTIENGREQRTIEKKMTNKDGSWSVGVQVNDPPLP